MIGTALYEYTHNLWDDKRRNKLHQIIKLFCVIVAIEPPSGNN